MHWIEWYGGVVADIRGLANYLYIYRAQIHLTLLTTERDKMNSFSCIVSLNKIFGPLGAEKSNDMVVQWWVHCVRPGLQWRDNIPRAFLLALRYTLSGIKTWNRLSLFGSYSSWREDDLCKRHERIVCAVQRHLNALHACHMSISSSLVLCSVELGKTNWIAILSMDVSTQNRSSILIMSSNLITWTVAWLPCPKL